MFLLFLLILLPALAWCMPCGVSILCTSVSHDYVGLCIGEYNILHAFVDYGYGNIQLQNTGIICDAVLPSDPVVVSASSDVLSYVVMSACYLFSFLFGFSAGRK